MGVSATKMGSRYAGSGPNQCSVARGRVKGDFLWPEASPENIGDSAKNNDSLVLRLRYGTRTFLLPGDAEKAAEHEILAENRPATLRSDILKIGHHGGNN